MSGWPRTGSDSWSGDGVCFSSTLHTLLDGRTKTQRDAKNEDGYLKKRMEIGDLHRKNERLVERGERE